MTPFNMDLNIHLVLPFVILGFLSFPPEVISNKCEDLEFCQDILLYNQSIYPNRFNHTTQKDARDVYNQFSPLIKTGCSKDLNIFLCFSFAPPCTLLSNPIPVCRSVCQAAVTKECLDLLKAMGFELPEVFECHKLPESGLCIAKNMTQKPSTSTMFPPIDTRTWYPEPGSFEETDSDIVVDLFFLTAIDNNMQLLKIRSPNDMDTMTIYRGLDRNQKHAMDYYLPEKYIYWASTFSSRIYRGTLQVETLRQIVPIVDTKSATVESLVVDWNLGVLFWSESVPVARIRTSSLSGRGVKTIVSDNILYPFSLTVDPTEGQIFWIDRRGDEFSSYSTIESFSVVTNRRRLIFNMTSLLKENRPVSLVADVAKKTLYWVDARSQSLHSIRYNGKDHKVLLTNHDALHEPDYLVINEDKVIWFDKLSRNLMWADKLNGEGLLKIKSFETYSPEILRLYGRKYQIMTTTYKKDMLASEWKELSSRENMEPPDLEEYDYRDNGYDDEENDNQRKNNNKGTGVSIQQASVVWTIVSCVSLVQLLNVK